MLKHYFKIAFRNIRKSKTFSFINVFGLALGISLCLVLIAILKVQFGYDKFEPGRERIYRINTEAQRKNGDTEPYASAPFPLGTFIKQHYPFAENVVRISGGLNGDLSFGDKNLSVHGFFTDADFFELFGFELLSGNTSTALSEPNSMVLTQKTSEKYFGKENPVGRIVTFGGIDDFKITGVIKPPPGKTHLEFDLLASNVSMQRYEKEEKIFPTTGNWQNYYSNYLYVRLKDNSQKQALEDALALASKNEYTKLDLETRDKGYRFYLHQLNKIVPGPVLSNNMGNAMPSQVLWIIGVFALVVLVSAGFNYNSLSIAKALDRAKEIGIRKTTGAGKKHLIYQFLTEAVLTALLAFALASCLFHFLLKPFFEQLSIFKSFEMVLEESFITYIVFAVFAMVIGFLSGLFPAFYLSSFRPVESLKNLKNAFSPRLGLRKVLMTIQLAVALLFVIVLFNMYRQMNYVMKADYGFSPQHIVNIDLQRNDYEKVRNVFAKNSNVLNISGISHSLGTSSDRAVDVRINPTDEKTIVRDYTIDENYIGNTGLQLVAGKNFTSDLSKERELFVLANENFVNHFHLRSPSEALNKTILLEDSLQVTIIGIVKDFHFRPFTYKIEPLLLRYHPADIAQLNIKTTGINDKRTLAELQQAWNTIDKVHPFSAHSFSDDLKDSYSEFNDITSLLALVAIMAITVAGMGFLGLVIFFVRQRLKEMTIRKVLGATAAQIAALVSRSFLKILFISLLVGLPLTIFVNTMIMETFAYKINPLLSYIWGVMLLLFILLLAMSSQVIGLITTNPVKVLRSE
jgi:putative ABC transport system permease protein